MQELLRYALIGLGVGSLYALAAQGLIVVYRGAGVLNFAQGAIGMFGAFVWWDLQYQHGHSFAFSLAAGILASAVLGALSHLLVMRSLRHAPPLVRLVATLGILSILQSIVVLRYGTDTRILTSELPTDRVHFFGDVFISEDRLILLAIAMLLTVALWVLYRYSSFGIGTSAVAENQRASAALGWSPDVIATANWTLGSALAGTAAILIAPIVQLQVATMTTLTVAAFSAALVASFRWFPLAMAAGAVIGMAQTVVGRYVDVDGLASSLPFVVIVLVLLLRGAALPVRGSFLERLPAVGTGRIAWRPAAAALVVAVLLIALASPTWLDAIAAMLASALIILSVVIITGYTGQISLAQYALAGMGAWVAGRLVDAQAWSFAPAALAGILLTIPVGVLIALPAVRTRGITLAVVTLGLGTALELMVFNSPKLTGGFAGTRVGKPDLFGFGIDSANHPERYALLSLAVFVVAALMVANLRRGRSGRRLLAVRTNERAAAALGINVAATKLYAFGVAGGIAAAGGILLAFKSETILYPVFSNFQSVTYVGYAVVGSLGYVLGPLLGAILVPGSLASAFSNDVLSGIAKYVPLIGGVTILLTVILYPDGMAHSQAKQFGPLLRRRREARSAADLPELVDDVKAVRVRPQTLEVRDLVVRYGGATAVDGVSLTVAPGRIVGLIGPNGAGKTTVIDAITGFVSPASGALVLDGNELGRSSASSRARAGVSRSFQSLELFEDLSVLDNLRAAADPRDRWAGLADLVRPKTPPLSGEVVAAISAFGLRDVLHRRVQDLPYGHRRLLAIARAVATQPSVLLLDEPAAGLGDHESAELARLVRTLPDRWGMAVLLVEHDMSFVMSVCDEIVVLDFGRQIARGTPAEVRGNPLVVSAYLGETDDELAQDVAAAVGGAR